MIDTTYNQKLEQALVGRKLRNDAMPIAHRGQPMFSLWGEDAGIPAGDVHNSRAYRIYPDYDETLTITGIRVVVEGEIISPCSGYRMEALDQFDYEPILNWCLARTEPAGGLIPKMIALDLDETLLNEQSRLSPGNRDALERAVAAGIHVVIASGRAYSTVPEEILRFPGIRYAICGNGAAVYETETGRPILRRVVPETAVEEILRCGQGQFLTYEAFVDGVAYGQADYIADPTRFMTDSQTVRYVQSSRRPVPDIVAFIRAHRTELDSIDIVVGDPETKQRMMERLGQIPGIYITTSVPRLVEISHGACGKHRALMFLAERLGVSREETAAFGNADNDAEMLAWAGTGVAVENASEACKESAKIITKHYAQDGVAEVIRGWLGDQKPRNSVTNGRF